MTFPNFIRIFLKSGVIGKPRDEIGADMMNAIRTSHGDKIVYSTAVKSWIGKYGTIYGLRSFAKFFPERKVDKLGFVRWLRRWTKDNWKELQQEFREASLSDVIDYETKDSETFYLSVYKEFLAVLDITPLEEIWHGETSLEPKSQTFEDTVQEKEIYEMRVSLDSALEKLEHDTLGQGIYSVFREIYDDYGISDYIQGIPNREFDITPFVQDIEQILLENFRKYFYAEMYMLVVEFLNELVKFNNLANLYTQKMPAKPRNELVAQQRKRLESLYKAMGALKTHNALTSYEHDLANDEVVYKRISILDN